MTDYLAAIAMFILYLAAPSFLYVIRDRVIARYKIGAQARLRRLRTVPAPNGAVVYI
jgi:hypothetical protein